MIAKQRKPSIQKPVSINTITHLLAMIKGKGVGDYDLNVCGFQTAILPDVLDALTWLNLGAEDRRLIREALGLPPINMLIEINYDRPVEECLQEFGASFPSTKLTGFKMPHTTRKGGAGVVFRLDLFDGEGSGITRQDIESICVRERRRQVEFTEMIQWAIKYRDFLLNSALDVVSLGSILDMPASTNKHFEWAPSIFKNPSDLLEVAYSVSGAFVSKGKFLLLTAMDGIEVR